MRRFPVLGLTLLTACASATPPAGPRSDMHHDPKHAAPAELLALNAELRQGAVVETIAGVRVEDAYRALENDSPQTQAWIAAQTERTERALLPAQSAEMQARLRTLLSVGSIEDVSIGGDRVFFTMREGDRDRPALYMRTLGAATTAAASSGELLIDPTSFGPRASIDYAVPSVDGRYVAFGISDNGEERATLRVREVSARRLLADALPHAKWSSVEWLHDGSGFFYTRYPRPGEPSYDASAEDSYYSRVFLHRLGEAAEADPLVFSGTAPTDFPFASVDESGRYVLLGNFRSWTASDVWLWDRGAVPEARRAAPAASELQPVITGRDASSLGTLRGGALFLLTSDGAPRKRIVRVDLARPSDTQAWQPIIPEGASAIEDCAITSRMLAVHVIDDIRSKLSLFDASGTSLGEVELPTRGSIEGLAASVDGSRVAFTFSSYLYPPALFSYDLREKQLTRVHQVQHDLDTSRFALGRAQVPSQDGTLVNVDYIHSVGMKHDRDNPVLLTGYGGFDVSLLPELRRSALYFVERGGIFAQANLRGGGEHGEAFHRAGMLQNKQRVFEDFEAVIKWLADSGLSRAERIAITGGSNGGLLMGAMLTRVPERFGAAVAYVGLYDMLRYAQFPPAGIWVSEYGDPSDPAMAQYLLAYSPYHRVRDGAAYPATLVETADHDTRVSSAHSTKFAARLQDASAGSAPIYFYMERAIGHGSGTGLSDQVRRESRKYAFLAQALRLTGATPAP